MQCWKCSCLIFSFLSKAGKEARFPGACRLPFRHPVNTAVVQDLDSMHWAHPIVEWLVCKSLRITIRALRCLAWTPWQPNTLCFVQVINLQQCWGNWCMLIFCCLEAAEPPQPVVPQAGSFNTCGGELKSRVLYLVGTVYGAAQETVGPIGFQRCCRALPHCLELWDQ